MKIVINGRFLTQGITGVQRFSHELVRELDKIVEKNQVRIVSPKGIIHEINHLKNIEVIESGRFSGHLWEQFELPFMVKKDEKLINLCNTAPLIKPSVVAIHDIQTRAYPEFFSKSFAMWYNFLLKFNTKNADKIITVSEFSKGEIMKYYNVPSGKIEVIYNGWQHMNRIAENESILEKHGLNSKEFYFAMGSMNPNKNFKYIINLAKENPDENFVIAGKINSKVFNNDLGFDMDNLKNVKYLGFVTDEELKALYKHAKAFIFPSIYEGFGIPPLEALSCGTKILISKLSCLPEIFSDSADYIDFNNIKKKITLRTKDLESKKKTIEFFSWEKSSEKLLSLMEKK